MKTNLKQGFLLFFLLLYSGICISAQNPLTQSDLKGVKAEQISDEQLIEFVEKARSSGLSEDQIINLASSRGMPASEIPILKDRISKLQVNSAPATTIQTPVVDKKPDLTTKSTTQATAGAATTTGTGDGGGIYGHDFFKNNSFQLYEKGSDAKAPDDYVIGTGDEFAVSVFGYSAYNEVLKVDINGYIRPSNIGVGPINLKGLTFGKAKDLIRAKISSSFDMSNNQLTITLAYSRIITVNIVGEVDKPGSYKIPAVNTAFNALIAVGGPNELGSVRNIQVKRNGKLIKTLDVYQFMSNPNSKLDYFLENNDYIFIPSSHKVVTIRGEVKRPMRYELLDKENLVDLINLAGGLTSKSHTKLISISRISPSGNERKLMNISLDSLAENKKQFALQDEDFIEIHSKLEVISNTISIEGSVNMPGTYELKNGERISDLIKKANGLSLDAYKEHAYLIRLKPDFTKEYLKINLSGILKTPPDGEKNLMLEKGDILTIASNKTFVDQFNITVNGVVRSPGSFAFTENMRISDLLFMAGGLKEEANKERAFLIRTKVDMTKEFILVNLKEILDSINLNENNLLLKRGDVLSILSIADFIEKWNINAIGLFRRPGTYEFTNGMTLSDLVYMAGGFKVEADLLRLEISRISFFSDEYKPGDPSRVIIKSIKLTKEQYLTDDQLAFKLNPFDQVFIRMIPDFEYPKNLTITGEVTYPGVYALSSKAEHVTDLIARAGGLNKFAFAEGSTLERPSLPGKYLVMNLRKALRNHRSEYNYLLKEGDMLSIPTVVDLIAIRGSVQYLELIQNTEQINAPYIRGKRAIYYIKEFSNGFGDHSWKRKTYVVDHNNKVTRTKNFVLFRIYPKVIKGATIFVVNKPVKEKKEKKEVVPVDWNKTISDFTVKLTGLATLYILMKAAGFKL